MWAELLANKSKEKLPWLFILKPLRPSKQFLRQIFCVAMRLTHHETLGVKKKCYRPNAFLKPVSQKLDFAGSGHFPGSPRQRESFYTLRIFAFRNKLN